MGTRREAIAVLSAGLVVACAPRSVAATKARSDLYACEGCDHALEADPDKLDWFTRIASPDEPGEPLVITGIVYQTDGKTPASGVVIYAHHTDINGYYPGGGPEFQNSARDGRLRAWLRTGEDGRYRFETIKPAPYPSLTMPAHIHLYIAEPGRRTYYIDDVVFADDPLVDAKYRAAQELRGGSGIVELIRDDGGRWLAQRDITLEHHP